MRSTAYNAENVDLIDDSSSKAHADKALQGSFAAV